MSDPNLSNPAWRLENLYLIRTKKAQVRKLKLNRIQRRLLADIQGELDSGRPVSSMVLKFRQGGASTFFNLLHLDRTVFTPNVNTGILADLRENLGYLFEMIRFAHDSMPQEFRPPLGSDSKSELTFPGIGSKIMVSLAFKSTTLHGLHVSEDAYIDRLDLQRTIGACTPDAWITRETTANGYNEFRDEWLERKASGKPGVFLPWPMQEEYRIPEGVDDLPPLNRTSKEMAFVESMQRRHDLAIDDAQLRFRRSKKAELKGLFAQEMAESEEECFLSTGGAFFDGRKLAVLSREALEQPPIGDDGETAWWEEPQPHHVYVAGADTAEGVGGDYSVMAVLCVTCRRTAFRYRAHCGVDFFYRLLNRVGVRYNRALLAPELNNHGHAVLMGLREGGYPNLYRSDPPKRTRVISRAGTAGGTPKVEQKFGWQTTADSKPLMLDNLKVALEGDSSEDEENFEPGLTWLDRDFLKEALNITESSGKIGAVTGKHDDLTVAYAIAWQMLLRVAGRSSAKTLGGIREAGRLESA